MPRSVLAGKKILITAGPTWVAVDSVRVISNISTGELGVRLAGEAVSAGASVDLLLGPALFKVPERRVRLFRYTYFNELKTQLETRLKKTSYDIVLHAAAVSDYVMRGSRGKLSSHRPSMTLRLTPAPKLVRIIRSLNPGAGLVIFKLEAGVTDAVLIKRARKALDEAGAQWVVANRLCGGAYRGFILDAHGDVLERCSSRQDAAKRLFRYLSR